MRGIILREAVPQVQTLKADVKARKRVGLLGGTFDPPHLGHLVVADQVGSQLDLDQIWFLPAFIPPHKEKRQIQSSVHRKNMILHAIKDNPFLKLDETELKRQGTSYTYDSIVALKENNPDTDFYFIIGGDMAESLSEWHRIEELVRLIQFVAVKRSGSSGKSDYPVIWVDCPIIEISSTMIRKKISQGCSVRYLVPEKTLEYIEQMGLYKNE